MQLLVVSGRSGSGKSSALNSLEDAGFCCMDNFPVSLLPNLFEKSETPQVIQKYAVSVDVRAPEEEISLLPEMLRHLSSRGIESEVLFLDADTPTLIRRFSETRRKHPLTNSTTDLQAALIKETEILAPLMNIADATINTSTMAPGMLSDALEKRFLFDKGDELLVVIESFGFKKGVPIDADFIFDVRCLPNPYWNPELREYNGLDAPVGDYLAGQDDVIKMIDSISSFLGDWIDCFKQGARSYLTIGIGCTGGKHRSVFVADQIKLKLDKLHSQVIARHRDLDL
jgi:RNase adapter protein RapZ